MSLCLFWSGIGVWGLRFLHNDSKFEGDEDILLLKAQSQASKVHQGTGIVHSSLDGRNGMWIQRRRDLPVALFVDNLSQPLPAVFYPTQTVLYSLSLCLRLQLSPSVKILFISQGLFQTPSHTLPFTWWLLPVSLKTFLSSNWKE